MRPVVALACLFSLLSGAALHAHADAIDAHARLEAMSRSFRSLNYRGVFTYEQGQVLNSVRIVHAVVDGVEKERLTHLDGEQREFLREGHRADCEHAGERLMRADPAGRFTLSDRMDAAGEGGVRLGDYYAIETDGAERVAGRAGTRIRIAPRDPYRYGMALVLDEASSLLLKSETTDSAGRVIERFQFVDVQIGGDIDATELQAHSSAARRAPDHGEPPAVASRPFAWTVSWLPQGFTLSGSEALPARAPGQPVEMQTYTDGLAVFAVFVERGMERPAKAGQASRGATVSYVVPRGAGSLVTVVGEIPIETAQLVANAVNFPDERP